MTRPGKPLFWSGLSIVVVFGTVMGLFVWKTSFDPVPPRYAPPFQRGQWIVTEEQGPQGYFRKELYIADGVKNGWIMIAASDGFALYLNGQRVAVEGPEFGNVSGVFDIGRFLHPGKNAVAVQVQRTTYPGPAKMVCEGGYLDRTGKNHPLFTDGSWRASSCEEMQGGRSAVSWKEVGFIDQTWSPARPAGYPESFEVAPLHLPAPLVTSGPQGKWIEPRYSSGRVAIYERSFSIPEKSRQAWIRITAEESYDLAVNGVLLADHVAPEHTFDIYSVGPLLKRGANIIRVRAFAPQSGRPRLLLDGMVLDGGEVKPIVATDSSWLTESPPSGQLQPAILLGEHDPGRDGPLVKNPLQSPLPVTLMTKKALRMLACVFSGVLIMTLAWGFSSRLLQSLSGANHPQEWLAMDGLLHLPPILFLGLVYLLGFDHRFEPGFPFQGTFPAMAVGFLVLCRLLLYLDVLRRKRRSERQQARLSPGRLPEWGKVKTFVIVLMVIAVMIAGLSLRAQNAQTSSLSHDEASMALFAKGVLARGAAIKTIGSIEKPLTTYELIPYPIALSLAVFGPGDLPVRIPSMLWAAATMILLFHVGRRLWKVWVGVLATAIYAFSPYAIVWGSNGFHPQQTQFFALLTGFFFYQAIQSDPRRILRPTYLYGAAGSFIVTYLSWEGSGFLLPSLFFCLLAARAGDAAGWLRNKHLWLAVGLIVVSVAIQLGRRILVNYPYIVVGTGLTGATFKLAFTDPLYTPWAYLQNFLFSGDHLLLSILVLLGLPFLLKDRALRYFCLLLWLLLTFLTNLMPNVSLRYVYFMLPFLILPASAVVLHFIVWVWRLPRERSWVLTAGNVLSASFLIVMILGATNSQLLELTRLGFSDGLSAETNPRVSAVDYRSTHRFLENRIRPEDAVISLMPHTLEYYAARESDYYIQTYTSRQVFYDVSRSRRYLDKYSGNPVIRNMGELQEVLNSYRRVWIVAAPFSAFLRANDDPLIEYVSRNARVAFESYRTRVYLWTR